jgi:hypothetical protein
METGSGVDAWDAMMCECVTVNLLYSLLCVHHNFTGHKPAKLLNRKNTDDISHTRTSLKFSTVLLFYFAHYFVQWTTIEKRKRCKSVKNSCAECEHDMFKTLPLPLPPSSMLQSCYPRLCLQREGGRLISMFENWRCSSCYHHNWIVHRGGPQYTRVSYNGRHTTFTTTSVAPSFSSIFPITSYFRQNEDIQYI